MSQNKISQLKFITGKRCDRGTKDPTDACASNPCWGDSICIVLETDNHFKCLCSGSRRGKYCQTQINEAPSSYDYNEQYSFESEGSSSGVAAEIEMITQRADQTEASTTPGLQSNLKGDAFSNLKNILLHGSKMNRTIADAALRNYSRLLGQDEAGRILNETVVMVTKPVSYKQRNVTTRGLYNTFVPTSDYQELCNYNTCQLGKCLSNGTCECVKPAVGKFCDQIDECLVLKCVHVTEFGL